VYLLRLTDPNDLQRLCDFLRNANVDTRAEGPDIVAVTIPGAATPLHERREVTGYITTWNALNPGSRVDLVDQP
jgi:hypothetical protein